MPPIASVFSCLLLKLGLNLLDNPRGHLPAEPLEAVGAGFDRAFGDFKLSCEVAKFGPRKINGFNRHPVWSRFSSDRVFFPPWHDDRLKPVGGYDLGTLVVSGLQLNPLRFHERTHHFFNEGLTLGLRFNGVQKKRVLHEELPQVFAVLTVVFVR